MPSKSENFGNVVVESLNQGTPVIATKGTPWELLEKNKCGWWVENSVESMNKIITNVINISSKQYDAYSKNAIKLVDEEFDIKKNINNWIEIYNK